MRYYIVRGNQDDVYPEVLSRWTGDTTDKIRLLCTYEYNDRGYVAFVDQNDAKRTCNAMNAVAPVLLLPFRVMSEHWLKERYPTIVDNDGNFKVM